MQASLRDLTSVQSMGREQLLLLQSALGFGTVWGIIDIPKHFMPAGSFQKISKRVRDFRQVAANNDWAIAAVTRYAILRWLVPMGQMSRPCTASTLAEDLSVLRRVLKAALSKPSSSPSRIWSRLSQNELYEIAPPTGKRNFGRTFETLALRKLLDDVIEITPRRRTDRLENVRAGVAKPRSQHKVVQPYVALPDAFVSECGWRCVWLIKELGPVLLKAINVAFEGNSVNLAVSKHSGLKKFRQRAKQKLQTFDWVDREGRVMKPSFELHLTSVNERGHHQPGRPLQWPPRSLPDLWRLAWLVQAAHAFVVGLSGGPREGELLSQTKASLVEDSNGWRIHGKTFKLVFRDDGQLRDWPAPRMCVTSVEQQVRLAELAHRAANTCGHDTEGPQLWVLLPVSDYATSGMQMNNIGSSFKGLVRILGLQHLLPSDSLRERTLHPHRLRKTTGRLVGLALTNGLQVLMDLYGHEDPEMTVGYLLSNKDIAEEAQAVAEAQTIMFAADAIANADDLGGKAAERIRDEVESFARLRGTNSLDAKNVDELARDLTENGRYWELVRPGVLCTKLPGQVGACNSKQGAPDSTHCRSSCDYRLEMAAQKENVNRTIERTIEHLERAIRDEELLAAEQWRGQLMANLFRFDDIRVRWSAYPLVAEELRKREVAA